MGYILIEESLFKKMMSKLLLNEDIMDGNFSESDYWMSGKEVCNYLNISKALLNAYRNSNILFYCKIKEIYHYKRAEVYKLKAQMDTELVESGRILNCEAVVNTEEDAAKILEDDSSGLYFEVRED